jgi:hypothetical protein
VDSDGVVTMARFALPSHDQRQARRANTNPLMLQRNSHVVFPCVATGLVHGDRQVFRFVTPVQQTMTSEQTTPEQGVCKSQQRTIRTGQRLRQYFAHENAVAHV